MGLGNGNPNEGNKGSNFNYELKTLQLLQAIAVAVEGGGGGGLTCTTVADCTVITDLQSEVTANTDQLLTIESACFKPTIIVTAGATITNESGQYQRVGNIVTCTVYFSIPTTAVQSGQVNIEVPIKDPASDYTASTSLIMGTLTPREQPKFTVSDFASGAVDGIRFVIATIITENIKSDYVAHFSYAYDTSLC
jgi:hypothetical protein